ESGLPVTLTGSSLTGPVTASCVSSNYSAVVTYTPAEGPKTFSASQMDSAQNETTVSRNVVKDTQAPVVRISQPAAGSVHISTINISGECESGLDVVIGGA